jgi:hypothetical protein
MLENLWTPMECEWLRCYSIAISYSPLAHRVVLMNYREDGVTPFVTIGKHGLTEMKV